ncbi:16S rRNA (adenine(1518)-N(6)/adenine(1519)-N(6))-dimethyltransferase RsmA [Fodinisporobacter ferrooxydans]|uniref:Ribosomal RNA small subunit methyltransferase A n=1 Tax=Fodinisporobacter ferrooxydans TaxID=2901836 RepID=A0ABY4CNF5_9BACL|nr:16S rRNA (adenine(1518)-N(6)/adenine(1519)-N(6))-dimethyltransferase RsmA [Alicyclobacillaceae bacterium MYW30-H2]
MSKQRLVHPAFAQQVIERHGFSLKKQLGQNFLIDANILGKIIDAAAVSSEEGVLEIGPGIGTLTQELAEHAGQVVAIEKDDRLISVLFDTLQTYSNVHVEHGDVLDVDLKQIFATWFQGRKVSVVANLPYYITTPIVMRLLEERLPLHSIVVMVQKEVAERMAAKPGGKDYGALSIAVQYYTRPAIVCKVPPSAFMPPPNVESTVIQLQVLSKPSVHLKDEALFFQVVKASFAQRRKTLVNNLLHTPFLTLTKEQIQDILAAVHIDLRQRGETLSLQDFANLSNTIYNYKQHL